MQLADQANRYIDERKPWLLAKQDGGDAELQAVCTQGLNLFRLVVGALKPVLPRTATAAETFLDAPLQRWEDLASPLLGRRIQTYAPLFTRIDSKDIASMTSASSEDLKPIGDAVSTSPAAVAPAASSAATRAPDAAGRAISIDDFGKLDLRIGRVVACEAVEGSDKLLRFELDAGPLGRRQIFSGIQASYPRPETLIGRDVVFIANLAPRKMRFGISEGMILSAGFDGGSLALLSADTGAEPGMPVK